LRSPSRWPVGGDAVRFAGDVPLPDDCAVEGQFHDGAVEVAVRARLTLGPTPFWKPDEEIAAEAGDVVGSLSAS